MNIIYLSPAVNYPIGGVKVIYKHAELLTEAGYSSFVYHPDNPEFSCSWFEHKSKMWIKNQFDPASDILIIPEMWASLYGNLCLKLGISYGIFVQNGYLMSDTLRNGTDQSHSAAYEGAKIIGSISSDTSKIISLAFPSVSEEKIQRLYPSVSNKFFPGKKQKIIAYMPRKLPTHALNMEFFLKQHIPQGWVLQAIDNKQEDQVVKILSESSIFLSFCDQEGCPLPPLEAAFSGCVIVGYAGQGGGEYFARPIFRSVDNGDYKKFVCATIEAVNDVENGLLDSYAYSESLNNLKKIYSYDNECYQLLKFADKIKELFRQ